MNVLKHEHRVLIDELTESIYDALDSDDIFDVIFAFVESKYQAELKDVNNPKLRLHIIQQRFSLALEECGLIDEIIESFPELNLNARLDKLKKEQSTLQSNILELNGKIDTIVDEMTRLQINSFGRVLRLFDNRVIDLAKDEEEIVVIERPNNRIPESTINHSTAPVWRTLQPAELLLGLQLTPSQPVLYRKTQHTWFPGRVLSCHLPNSDPSTPKSDKDRAKENENAQYTIALDTSSKSKSEICFAVTSSLALAFSASELRQKYPVGARVVSIYRDDTGGIGYYSGLIAEPPSERNNQRYLLFFDDGYTQYSPPNEVYRICHQSKENWKEATESSQEFIKRYLAQYPQRPMVRLKPGQTVETELDGDWMKATVEKVDASLALMKFSRTHSEWIYRGSTRLEPLFSDLLSSQSKSVPTHNQRVEVEYSSVDVPLDSSAKRRKARKSATGNQNTAMSVRALSSGDSHKISNSIHQTNKSLSNYNNEALKTTSKKGSEKNINEQCLSIDPITNLSELESTGTKTSYLDNLFKEFDYKPFESHKCGHYCLKSYRKPSSALSPILCSENPVDYKGLNPLEIPFHCGWLRYLAKYDPPVNNKCNIIYTAPCGRSLRSMHEVERFLDKTNSQLTADLFSFDSTLIINQEFRAEKTLTNIVDLSYGKENVPIPCVNSVDNEVPGYIDYTPQRQPIGNVPLLKDSKFLVCCDCTDNCRDRTKCACQQLTVEASSLTNPNGLVDSQAGYRYRRLSQFTVGGVYECNSNCQCDRRCSNRVVQQGLWVRLQVFKTARKGWGIRALNAIPKGTFICTYAGAIYDEAMAVQEGFDCGDEYQAELDYIETVEKDKEGYESTVEDLNEILNETTVALIQRSASLEPEIKDRKPLERSKSHRKDSEKQHRRQHHHHHHHHRNHRQQQLQQLSQSHQQNQQQTKRMYPVAQKDWLRARTYFNDINPYIMDAKKMGNLGRYFNHSCNPNVFVQNVFIDTHDPRFPEVAFFAKRNIDVGEEMTWDYGYTVDAVPFKVLYCYCGEPNCRIRLL
ncbi:putative histone-lysine n-methyltransferase, setb1 [Schistosoma mansoni]|uniref:putative histone-lysine n-methyltransferase, setb1 n=2 Tax=Schistosoma mansoni TaxID=6183 RepID=UPI0001A637CF|nr:putative histone-lysine n-methyltransferase, setb1 [Schistosoma mansoni]|eukprot:XP_018652007.1 putative histone-lysine n-methyltransferase, setb1 [Schistosoma mansoni]